MSGEKNDSGKESKEPGFDFQKIQDRAGQIWSTAVSHTSSALVEYAPRLKNFGFVTEPARKLLETVDAEAYKISDKLNRENPRLATMCRSHMSQVILTSSFVVGTVVAVPTRRLFGGPFVKTFIYTGLFNAAIVYSLASVVQYKWENPRTPTKKA